MLVYVEVRSNISSLAFAGIYWLLENLEPKKSARSFKKFDQLKNKGALVVFI